jgi:hypothetical protein
VGVELATVYDRAEFGLATLPRSRHEFVRVAREISQPKASGMTAVELSAVLSAAGVAADQPRSSRAGAFLPMPRHRHLGAVWSRPRRGPHCAPRRSPTARKRPGRTGQRPCWQRPELSALSADRHRVASRVSPGAGLPTRKARRMREGRLRRARCEVGVQLPHRICAARSQ